MQFFMGLKKRRGTKKFFLVEKMSRFSKKGRQKVSLVPKIGSPIKHFNCSEDDAFLEQKKRLDTIAQVEPFLPRLLFALNAVMVHASFMNGPPYSTVCCHFFKYLQN